MKETYHHGNLRQALVDEGARVAASDGVDAVRVNVLARRLGVSSAAPFRHFPTREALLVAIGEEGARLQALAVRDAQLHASDPLEAQLMTGVAYVRWAVENPGHFRVLSRVETLEGSATLRAQSAAAAEQLRAVLDPDAGADSAVVLAARALAYGLASMAVDGLLGPVDGSQAAVLAEQTLRVLGSHAPTSRKETLP